MTIIKFINVGREKRTWEHEFKSNAILSDAAIIGQIKKAKVLMSRDISISINDAETGGMIFAGVHKVGDWAFVDSEQKQEEIGLCGYDFKEGKP